MTPTIITVTGRGERTYPPEQCTVDITVAADADGAAEAYAPVAAVVVEVTDLVTDLFDESVGPVTRWSVEAIHQHRYRPYNDHGNQRPWVHRAWANLEVRFGVLGAVDEFVFALAHLDEVSITGLTWELTRTSLDAKLTTVRDLAVRDAVGKATMYAISLGLSTVDAVALADPGMLGVSASRGGSHETMAMVGARSMPAEIIELRPAPVTVRAEVDARFEAHR